MRGRVRARRRCAPAPARRPRRFTSSIIWSAVSWPRRSRSTWPPSFESEGKTFRDEAFAAYKANRTETPPDLLEQIPWIRKTLEAMRIPVLEYPGFEADDVIGTLSKRAIEQHADEVIIVSSDKDMLQLVNDRVRMLNPMKDDMVYDATATEEFMGVRPDQVADLLALKGDTSTTFPARRASAKKARRI